MTAAAAIVAAAATVARWRSESSICTLCVPTGRYHRRDGYHPAMAAKRRFQTVKGMRDLLPGEAGAFAQVEATARRVFTLYGYREVRTPVVEDTDLFVRGVGEGSEIVGKQMYTFDDKKGRSLTLRPEGTAPVARAYLQHDMASLPQPVKVFYMGPYFRYERPQAGRFRQFSQIGAEVIGDPGPYSDVELLVMLLRFLEALGFEDLEVGLNSVGDPECRQRYSRRLREFLEPHRDELGADSRRRLGTNPLRILDTKAPGERRLLEDAPHLREVLGDPAREHFEVVCEQLERFGCRLPDRRQAGARGLDYYTRTVFEITSGALGAQDAILGGGRYDGLIGELGGPAVPGIGFAIGEDRLVDVLPDSSRVRGRRDGSRVCHRGRLSSPCRGPGPGGGLASRGPGRDFGVRCRKPKGRTAKGRPPRLPLGRPHRRGRTGRWNRRPARLLEQHPGDHSARRVRRRGEGENFRLSCARIGGSSRERLGKEEAREQNRCRNADRGAGRRAGEGPGMGPPPARSRRCDLPRRARSKRRRAGRRASGKHAGRSQGTRSGPPRMGRRSRGRDRAPGPPTR